MFTAKAVLRQRRDGGSSRITGRRMNQRHQPRKGLGKSGKEIEGVTEKTEIEL